MTTLVDQKKEYFLSKLYKEASLYKNKAPETYVFWMTNADNDFYYYLNNSKILATSKYEAVFLMETRIYQVLNQLCGCSGNLDERMMSLPLDIYVDNFFNPKNEHFLMKRSNTKIE